MNVEGVREGKGVCEDCGGRVERIRVWGGLLSTLLLDRFRCADCGKVFRIERRDTERSYVVKRLHDLNQSGWWLFLMFAPWLVVAMVEEFYSARENWYKAPVTWYFWIAILLYYIAILWYSLGPGVPGPNEYGPDPLDREGRSEGDISVPGDESTAVDEQSV